MALVIFDLDETLLAGDSSSLFCHFLVEQGLADQPFIVKEQQLMALYSQQQLSMDDYIAFQLSPLASISVADIEVLLPTFVANYIAPRFYPEALELIAQLRAQGDRILVISATAAFIVRAACQHLGIDDVIAIELEESEAGYYTGQIRGIPSYREGKVTRLKAWLNSQNETLENASFYSDSINDLPLLEAVPHPIATNPDDLLKQTAIERTWQTLTWTC